jgi:hypothetical protein
MEMGFGVVAEVGMMMTIAAEHGDFARRSMRL